jgi:hypothetical protein
MLERVVLYNGMLEWQGGDRLWGEVCPAMLPPKVPLCLLYRRVAILSFAYSYAPAEHCQVLGASTAR